MLGWSYGNCPWIHSCGWDHTMSSRVNDLSDQFEYTLFKKWFSKHHVNPKGSTFDALYTYFYLFLSLVTFQTVNELIWCQAKSGFIHIKLLIHQYSLCINNLTHICFLLTVDADDQKQNLAVAKASTSNQQKLADATTVKIQNPEPCQSTKFQSKTNNRIPRDQSPIVLCFIFPCLRVKGS